MKLIGKGNTAEVFELEDGKIIKLFVKGYPEVPVKHEYQNACFMHSLDVDVPACYEMKEMDNRYGIVYEKVNGKDLFTYMMEKRDVEKGVQILYRLQSRMLSFEGPDLMSYKDFIKMIIGDRYPETIAKLEKLPDDIQVCHGDFHLFNILIDDDEKAFVIDFMNVCKGPKLYDIARTYYLINGDGKSVDEVPDDQKEIVKMRNYLLERYLQLHGVRKEEIEPYLEIIEVCHQCEMLG